LIEHTRCDIFAIEAFIDGPQHGGRVHPPSSLDWLDIQNVNPHKIGTQRNTPPSHLSFFATSSVRVCLAHGHSQKTARHGADRGCLMQLANTTFHLRKADDTAIVARRPKALPFVAPS
jgi:hypothetical protein